MKKIIFLTLMGSMSAAVQSSEYTLGHYIGAEAKLRHIPFAKSFGHNIFRENFPEGNVFFGLKFNDNFGVEVGYSQTTLRRKNASISGPETILGLLLPAGRTEVFTTTAQMNALNMILMGFVPLNENWQLLGGVGIARTHLKLSYQPTANASGQLSPNVAQARIRDFSKNKYIMQAKIGAQYRLTNDISLRTLLGWENTGKFKLLSSKQPSALKTSLKDSFTLSMGLAWHF